MVGWALERTLATRLTRTALERAIAARQPAPGLVHHSDRGVQYASDEYVQVLQEHRMIPSMSRSANPYDNASCESFMKTLKGEEIYDNDYVDLKHLCSNIEAFIDDYYNRSVSRARMFPLMAERLAEPYASLASSLRRSENDCQFYLEKRF